MVHLLGGYFTRSKNLAQQVALPPHNAVYWLTGCAPDRADREALRSDFRATVVACGDTLLDHLYLPVKACCAALDERNIGGQAHLVDMSSGFEIVQRIEDDSESLEPVDVKLGIFYVGVVGFELDVWVEFLSNFFRYLEIYEYLYKETER